jgi:hypothetical protein
MVEDAVAASCISRNVEYPHLLAGMSASSALLLDLGSNRHLAGGGQHHSPGGSCSEMSIPVEAAFAGSCAELVDACAESFGIGDANLVEDQQTVGVLGSCGLERIGRSAARARCSQGRHPCPRPTPAAAMAVVLPVDELP